MTDIMAKARGVVLFIAIFLLNSSGNVCFSQRPEQKAAQVESLPEEIERAVTKAIKDVDKDKIAQEEALLVSIQEKFQSAVDQWMANAKAQKELEVGKLVNQNWEQLSQFGPRIHQIYYLRGYAYSKGDTDIIKTNSMLATPYKAYLKATETLYVQKEHPAGASDVTQFFYTVTTPLKLNFDYKKDKFVLIGVERVDPSLIKGWPQAIADKLKAESLKY